MSDITKLRDLLVEYEQALDRHRADLKESFDDVKKRYANLRDVYDGVAAREFKVGWGRTSGAFDAYTERLDSLRPLLNERIEALSAVDRNHD